MRRLAAVVGKVDAEGRALGEPRVEEVNREGRADAAVGEQVRDDRIVGGVLAMQRHRGQQDREAQAQANREDDGKSSSASSRKRSFVRRDVRPRASTTGV